MLAELWGYATDEALSWTHDWIPGDLMLWDNRQLIHQASKLGAGEESCSYRVGVYEDIPQHANRVSVDRKNPMKAATHYGHHSDYAQRGIDRFGQDVEKLLEGLPVEKIHVRKVRNTEGHILGTARMGTDPETSVVDADCVHHEVRNLLVLGGSSFPTGSVANPSLTIAALSLRVADRLMARGPAPG